VASLEPANGQVTAWAEVQRSCPHHDQAQSLEVFLAGVVEGVFMEVSVVGAVVLSGEPDGHQQEVRHAHDLSQIADQVWVALWSRKPGIDNPEKPQAGFTDRPGSCIDEGEGASEQRETSGPPMTYRILPDLQSGNADLTPQDIERHDRAFKGAAATRGIECGARGSRNAQAVDLDDVFGVKRASPVDDVFAFGEMKALGQEERQRGSVDALEPLAIEVGGPEQIGGSPPANDAIWRKGCRGIVDAL
jgi:hypothetical protein